MRISLKDKSCPSAFVMSAYLLLFLTWIGTSPVSALDLGIQSQGSAAPQPVEVTNEPLKTTEEISAIKEIAHEVMLNFDQEHTTSVFDVRDFRHVTFYVIPQKVLNEPQVDIRYRLDAFFTVEAGMTKMRKFGEKEESTTADFGFQEFGAKQMVADDHEESQFIKLTTGETGGRMLSTPVYGPFAYVTLKSLTQADKRRFRIVAYLTR